MWHCDELLTIVVLALVNRFVHGRVPTTVVEILMGTNCAPLVADLFLFCYEKGLYDVSF